MEFVSFDKFTPIPNFENYGINKCGDVCSFIKKNSACLRGKSKTSGGYIWKYATLK